MNPKRVLDIGANVGQWSDHASQVWPLAFFHLVEANPGCRERLESQPYPFTICLLGAVRRDSVPFYAIGPHATGASVYREVGTDLYRDCQPVYLPQTTLDDLFPDDQFDLIKLDTQGSEIDILQGGVNLVDRCHCVMLEVSTKIYNEGAPLFPAVIRYMDSIGFTHRAILRSPDSLGQMDVMFCRDESFFDEF